MRVPSADRLVAPDKCEGIGCRKLNCAVSTAWGTWRAACVHIELIHLGWHLYLLPHPLKNDNIAKRTRPQPDTLPYASHIYREN